MATATNPIRRHYDKLILGVALLFLAATVAVLLQGRSSAARARANFDRDLDAMRPKNEFAPAADLAPYEATLRHLAKPFQASVSSNNAVGFLSPEARIWCVKCKKPIPFHAETCVFCGFAQPKPPEANPEFDSDGGGIPDADEERYGLDKYNAKDDTMDSDGDGFSNLDEHLAKTDPMDPASHPDFAKELRVKSIEGHQLPMLLRGKTRNPDGSYKCQINGANQTFWVSVGGEVGKTGYKLASFEALSEKRADEKLGGFEREVDVSRATLEKDGRKVVLVMNEPAACTDYDIVLFFRIDKTEIRTSNDATFKLRDRTYRVSGVDTEAQSVVISDETAGVEVSVSAGD